MYKLQLVKEIPFSSDFTAKFYTLYEDKRDVMCDSLRPEWGTADCTKNHRVTVVDRRGITVFSRDVNKNEGNAMYREMKPLDRYGYGYALCVEWLRKNGANV